MFNLVSPWTINNVLMMYLKTIEQSVGTISTEKEKGSHKNYLNRYFDCEYLRTAIIAALNKSTGRNGR